MQPDPTATQAIAVVRAWSITRAFRPGQSITLTDAEARLLERFFEAYAAGRDREGSIEVRTGKADQL